MLSGTSAHVFRRRRYTNCDNIGDDDDDNNINENNDRNHGNGALHTMTTTKMCVFWFFSEIHSRCLCVHGFHEMRTIFGVGYCFSFCRKLGNSLASAGRLVCKALSVLYVQNSWACWFLLLLLLLSFSFRAALRFVV